jgi:uncharacterized protein
MTDTQIVERTMAFVQETLQGAEGGHDWFHIQRVYRNTLLIAKNEKVDLLVVSLAALLHDIADAKFHGGDESIGPKIAREFLTDLGVAENVILQVVAIILNSSYKTSLESSQRLPTSKELEVVQDADRLDAMGAIGIARAFNYGGHRNRGLYDPNVPPNTKMTKEQYKNSNAPTLNHFYEKLLLLKDKMNTDTGKILAKERHRFMLDYLDHFYREWNGEV